MLANVWSTVGSPYRSGYWQAPRRACASSARRACPLRRDRSIAMWRREDRQQHREIHLVIPIVVELVETPVIKPAPCQAPPVREITAARRRRKSRSERDRSRLRRQDLRPFASKSGANACAAFSARTASAMARASPAGYETAPHAIIACLFSYGPPLNLWT